MTPASSLSLLKSPQESIPTALGLISDDTLEHICSYLGREHLQMLSTVSKRTNRCSIQATRLMTNNNISSFINGISLQLKEEKNLPPGFLEAFTSINIHPDLKELKNLKAIEDRTNAIYLEKIEMLEQIPLEILENLKLVESSIPIDLQKMILEIPQISQFFQSDKFLESDPEKISHCVKRIIELPLSHFYFTLFNVDFMRQLPIHEELKLEILLTILKEWLSETEEDLRLDIPLENLIVAELVRIINRCGFGGVFGFRIMPQYEAMKNIFLERKRISLLIYFLLNIR